MTSSVKATAYCSDKRELVFGIVETPGADMTNVSVLQNGESAEKAVHGTQQAVSFERDKE